MSQAQFSSSGQRMSYNGYEDLRPEGTFRIEKGYSGSGYGGHSGYGGGGGYGGGCSIGICEILAVGAAIAVAVAAGAALFLAVQMGRRKKRSMKMLEEAGLLAAGSLLASVVPITILLIAYKSSQWDSGGAL